MNHTEKLSRYVANFIDELHRSGLSDVVISPGSRSTPLAMLFAEHEHIKHWVNMDERSAAFFALGMAKQQKKPVALVCTSGTAAANYFPAIVEAYYSRVPLLILTADRPHELRDVGAPQAIEQIKLYGDCVKWFHEMALPDMSPEMLEYVRGKASRALRTAEQGNAGPVHLNFPFREPLVPDFTISNLWGKRESQSGPYNYNWQGERSLHENQLDELVTQLGSYQKGLIVCGPQEDDKLVEAIVHLAETWGLPILADPLSQLRSGNHNKATIIEGYDSILKSKRVREKLNPEFILRFGAMPVSKPYLLFLKENELKHFVVEKNEGHREPVGRSTSFIFADPTLMCYELANNKNLSFDKKWLEKWQTMNHITKEVLLNDDEQSALTEGHVVKHVAEMIPDDSLIYVSNSMPIRDVDTFFMSNAKQITILANRGANGIDGITSSALGAAAYGKHVTLLLGDLSFFHDFNALMIAKQYNIDLTIILINNNGGGIFSFLPQANEDSKHYEVLFGTPLHIDFKHILTMYQASYQVPQTWHDFDQAVTDSYNHKGLSVIEVKTNREENVRWHKQRWQAIEQRILEKLKG